MYNVLVCDDEKDIVSALKIYLTADGYEIFEAYNGKEALERIYKSNEKISLILLDLLMPEMDGFEFIKKYKEDISISDIPIIVMTAEGEAEADIIIEAQNCLVDAFWFSAVISAISFTDLVFSEVKPKIFLIRD